MIGKRAFQVIEALALSKIFKDGVTNKRCYYVAAEPRPEKAWCDAIRALHMMPELPWPDEECIIIAERLGSNKGWRDLEVFARLKTNAEELGTCPHPLGRGYDGVDVANYDCLSAIRAEWVNGGYRFRNPEWGMMRRLQCTDWADGEMPKEFLIELKHLDAEDRQYFRGCWPVGGSVWTSQLYWLTDKGEEQHRKSTQFAMACRHLRALANIIMPCHYAITATHKGTIGHRGLRKKMAGRQMGMRIPYERLYEVNPEMKNGQVHPHHRRGHVRWLWKHRGIDRMTLPADPAVRIAKALTEDVPMVKVRPSWIGAHQWGEDGVGYEIDK